MNNVSHKKKEECSGCGMCQKICPANAIEMKPNDHGFVMPIVNNIKCINCGKCLQECVFANCLNNTQKKQIEPLELYVARDKKKYMLAQCASGGIFSEIALTVLALGGFVYGAAYDVKSNFAVRHVKISNRESLSIIKNSKYVQSNIIDIYQEIQEDLKMDKVVLFSGTPCQVAAVKRFLDINKVDSRRLITCDLICHGVGSPQIWNQYVMFIQEKVGNINSISMRSKKFDSGYNVFISGEVGSYNKYDIEDPYIYLFSKNLILRESCYCCPYKSWNRISDITIGDYPKVRQFFPEFDDGLGISTVLINTKNGEKIFDNIKDLLLFNVCSKSQADQKNLHVKIMETRRHDAFFDFYITYGFKRSIIKFTNEGVINNTIYKTKQLIKKLVLVHR